jgi:hypothetical protein
VIACSAFVCSGSATSASFSQYSWILSFAFSPVRTSTGMSARTIVDAACV